MGRILLFLIICIGFTNLTVAQTIRTDVFVYGGTASGVAAGIQAAHSGVKTFLLEEKGELGYNIIDSDTLKATGLRADLVKRQTKKDTVAKTTNILPIATTLKGWTDTVKNLTVMLNMGWQKIEQSGKGWDIKLKNGRTVKADIVIDATQAGELAKSAGAVKDADGVYKTSTVLTEAYFKNPYSSLLYRTSVAASADNPYGIPASAFVSSDKENLILVGKEPGSGIEAGMTSGQAAGAIAAYCAFFKKTTKSLNVRVIQGELLGYRSLLVPFSDIAVSDSNSVFMQRIAVTGVLKGKMSNGKLIFQPDTLVRLQDVRQPIREYYTRSQIWLADNSKIDILTLENTLSLIKYIANRGQELNREVEKSWKGSFKFPGTFDLKRNITRREFAVLIQTYLKPFNVQVDQNGKLQY